MSTQSKYSLNNLLEETRVLKEKVRQFLPSYTTLLKELSPLPEELERRFWVSCVEALLDKVKEEFQSFEAKARKVELLGKFMTMGMDIALKAGGMEPVAPPPPAPLGISISPSGKINPAVLDAPLPEPSAVLVSIERFEVIVRHLEDEITKGKALPEDEVKIPRLIYDLALNLNSNRIHQ